MSAIEEKNIEGNRNLSGMMSAYDKKKTLAEGLLDLGLLMANASQLKALLSAGSSHEYFWAILVCLILSIIIQMAVALLLFVLGAREWKDKDEHHSNILNNVAVALIFIITVLNVFISAFGIKLSG